jgi:hypothetical protein
MSDKFLAQARGIEDVNIADGLEDAATAVARAQAEGTDDLATSRAKLVEAEIVARQALDNMILSTVNVAKIFDVLTGAIENLLELIPGVRTQRGIQRDIEEQSQRLSESQLDVEAAKDSTGLFANFRRNEAANNVIESERNIANLTVEMVDKGGEVDDTMVQKAIETLTAQLELNTQMLDEGTINETGDPLTDAYLAGLGGRETQSNDEIRKELEANIELLRNAQGQGTSSTDMSRDVDEYVARMSTPETPATPDMSSARESRIATERENSNRRIQLSSEGYSLSEIESMMAANSMRPSGALLESDLVGTVEQPATSEVSTARLSEETPTDHYLKTVAELESGNNPNARASTSSASGTYQITDKTWEDAVSQMGKDWTIGDKNDTAKQEEVVNYLYDQQREALERELGRKTTEQEMYMAHFLGQADAIKLLTEAVKNPQTNASELLPSAAESNPAIFSEGTTALDIVNELTSKFNVVSNRVASEANATVSELPNEIASLTTPDAPAVTQTAPRALASAIETPTPAQVTAAITPAPVAQPTQSTTPVVTTTTTQANTTNTNNDISDIMSLLSYKLDAVIALLDTGVSIQDRILLESRS